MATYKEIHGTNIEVVSSDPSNPVEGQLWYNSTSNTVKGLISNPGSFVTGAGLNTHRTSLAGAGANYTTALAFGGYSSGVRDETEKWNGTAWTVVNTLNTARSALAGAGTQTLALGFGGYLNPGLSTATEKWNGTNWTNVNSLNTA